MGKVIIHLVARSTARGRGGVSPCCWSLPGGSGQLGRPLSIRWRDRRLGGEGLCCLAGGRCPGGAAIGEGHDLPGCGSIRQGHAGYLAMPVVAARAERPLGKTTVSAVAGSLARGRRGVAQCWWSLPGCKGHARSMGLEHWWGWVGGGGVQRGLGGARCRPHLWLPALFRLPRVLVWVVPTLVTTCREGSTLGVWIGGGGGGGCSNEWLRKKWEGPTLGASSQLARALGEPKTGGVGTRGARYRGVGHEQFPAITAVAVASKIS